MLRRLASGLLYLLLFCIPMGLFLTELGAGAAFAAGLDPGRLQWSRLEYRASKFGISLTAEVELDAVPAAQAAAAFVSAGGERGLAPRGRETLRMVLDSRLPGRESTVAFWFEPDTAGALQREQLETGRKARRNRHKVARFTGGGVFHVVRRPTDGEVGLPHQRWSEGSEDFQRFQGLDGAAVTEPAALFYVLAVGGLERPGDRVSLPMISKGRLFHVDLEVAGSERVRADYRVEGPQGRQEVDGPVEALHVRLTPRPLGGGGSEEDSDAVFEFLGLRGDVDLYLDPALRAPVLISGQLRWVGRGHIRLQRLVRRPETG